MHAAMRAFIREIMTAQPDLTIATLRSDGWPQATTVSYANDNLDIYFATNRNSQKAVNIQGCARVSATINKPYNDWSRIQGLSMAATAEILTDSIDIERATAHIVRRFPQAAGWAGELPDIVFVQLTPKIISVLDYTKGFGHTELFEL